MSQLYDLAMMSTATTGTGTITLGSAVAPYLTFAAAGVQGGDVVSYAIFDPPNSECGHGTYTASGTTLSRTVSKSTNSNAAINLSGNAQVFITVLAEDLETPTTIQTFTSGSGTYTPTSAQVKWIEILMSGAGSGSGGSGVGSTAGALGGDTTFGTSLLTAKGAAACLNAYTAGAPGAATGGNVFNLTGNPGQPGTYGVVNGAGGNGAGSPIFGGGGLSSGPGLSAGAVGASNSGSGPSGAGISIATQSGCGGSSGGGVKHIIFNPLAAGYAYAVGAGGTAGVAGSSGSNGAAGSYGIIIVIEHYR